LRKKTAAETASSTNTASWVFSNKEKPKFFGLGFSMMKKDINE